jgi:hypothetical protein
MSNKLKTILAGFGLSFAALFGAADEAFAYGGQQCREYTRTVYIGNRAQEAYGTACLQPDGSWMIVGEGLGNDIGPNVNSVDYVIHDDNQVIVPPRVVYYERPPSYYYRTQPPRPYSVWHNDGRFYRNGIYVNIGGGKNYHKHKHWDRHDRRDRHDHRGHGRGHGGRH